MATTKQIRMAALMTVVLGMQAAWAGDLATTQPSESKAPATVTVKREIVISLEDRKLALVENGQAVKIYSVAVGKSSTPSPAGNFTIERRVANPTYHHDGKTIPPGPGNPVGTRWMGLSIKGYGIHGTNEPKSIGKAASHGCIRMAKADLEELYPLVEVGDSVEIVGHRDEETAQLFGTGVTPAGAAQIELAAKSVAPAATAITKSTAAAEMPGQAASGRAEVATAAILTGVL
jgi:lipoprotein-anchoring transpeptidase ErfK/SrfK